MTEAQEKAFDKKAEKHFKSHRELPTGRDFRAFGRDPDPSADQNYRDNFNATFPNAPGANFD